MTLNSLRRLSVKLFIAIIFAATVCLTVEAQENDLSVPNGWTQQFERPIWEFVTRTRVEKGFFYEFWKDMKPAAFIMVSDSGLIAFEGHAVGTLETSFNHPDSESSYIVKYVSLELLPPSPSLDPKYSKVRARYRSIEDFKLLGNIHELPAHLINGVWLVGDLSLKMSYQEAILEIMRRGGKLVESANAKLLEEQGMPTMTDEGVLAHKVQALSVRLANLSDENKALQIKNERLEGEKRTLKSRISALGKQLKDLEKRSASFSIFDFIGSLKTGGIDSASSPELVESSPMTQEQEPIDLLDTKCAR